MSLVRFTGPLSRLTAAERAVLLQREPAVDAGLTDSVRAMIAAVRTDGDAALRTFARRFDRVELAELAVPLAAARAAFERLPRPLASALQRLADNLARVAAASLPRAHSLEVEPGVVVGRTPEPLARIGVYAPGGTAAYASSVLMGLVPARVAGCAERVLCSPPGPNGVPADVVLAAAWLGGATSLFAIGGAGAIAAMAYGTQSVPRCDRLVGPGNSYVATAKQLVAGDVGIDAPAGPSEILVVADATAEAAAIARELLAQAEHDPDACCLALCVGEGLASAVLAELARQLPRQPRAFVCEQALRSRGAVLQLDTLASAWPFVAAFAPEHLQLQVADPAAALANVRCAGTVFVGASSSVAFGDYLTGSNHVLPTAGAARRCSGLSVADFVRWQSWQQVDAPAARLLCADTVRLAEAEGLPAHAAAAAAFAADGSGEAAARPYVPRPELLAVSRYLPVGAADTNEMPPFDLSDNTSAIGMPPAAAAVLRAAAADAVVRYPSAYADDLRGALAAWLGVPAANVVTGCGSDAVLDAAFRALARPGDRLAYVPPTFSMVPAWAVANDLEPVPCALEVQAFVRSGARLVYLAAPNNPTGAMLPPGLLDELLANTSLAVVLDEAYVEFASSPSQVRRAVGEQRMLVVRTLSKAWGLAGLRVGYAVGALPLVAAIERTRGPFQTGGLVAAAAAAAVATDAAWLAAHVDGVRRRRERFVGALQQVGLLPLPSEANFVLLPCRNRVRQPRSANEIANALRQRGVLVRALPDLPGLGDAIRIGIGTDDTMARAAAAVVEVLA
jgi:histidinol dehydrogenase